MKNKSSLHTIFLLLSFFLLTLANGQQTGALTFKGYLGPKPDFRGKYLLLDFWATWCGPCLGAISATNELVEKYADKLVVLSVTEEDSVVVQDFINSKRFDFKSTVALDDLGSVFRRFKVKSIPYFVLFDPMGVKLWEGHPNNFNEDLLKSTASVAPESKVNYNEPEISSTASQIYFDLAEYSGDSMSFDLKPYYISFQGPLKSILPFLLGTRAPYIKLEDESIKFSLEVNLRGVTVDSMKNAILQVILARYNLNITRGKDRFDAYNLTVNKPKMLWPQDSLVNEGVLTMIYFRDDGMVEFDNIPISKFTQTLEDLVGKPVVVDYKSSEPHDWMLSRGSISHMTDYLKRTYDIDLEPAVKTLPVWIVSKK